MSERFAPFHLATIDYKTLRLYKESTCLQTIQNTVKRDHSGSTDEDGYNNTYDEGEGEEFQRMVIVDGRIIQCGHVRNLFVWDLEKQTCEELTHVKHWTRGVLLLKDGRLAITYGRRVRIMNLNDKTFIDIVAHSNDITQTIQMENGHLVTSSKDKTVKYGIY